jgi:hypothetical protein
MFSFDYFRFFFDLKQSPAFEIIMVSYVIQQLSHFIFQSFNILFIMIGNCLESQFKVLQQNIAMIKIEDFKDSNKNKLNLINFRYNELVRLTENFNSVYHFTANTNFFMFVILSGAYAFELVKVIDSKILEITL